MDKDILKQYIDACEVVKTTQRELEQMKRRRKDIVRDVVKGSSKEFPYTQQAIRIEGSTGTQERMISREEELLEARKQRAAELKEDVERWMVGIDMRMQRIIDMAIFKHMRWDEVAANMGRGATAESVRKEFERFMKK